MRTLDEIASSNFGIILPEEPMPQRRSKVVELLHVVFSHMECRPALERKQQFGMLIFVLSPLLPDKEREVKLQHFREQRDGSARNRLRVYRRFIISIVCQCYQAGMDDRIAEWLSDLLEYYRDL